MATRVESRATRAALRGNCQHRLFFPGIATLILLLLLVAFGDRYFARALADADSFPLVVHAHAIVFTAWVILLVVQTGLVAAGNVALHRRLGIAGAVLAGLMIPLGAMVALYGARRGHNPSGGAYPDAAAFLIVGLTDILLFAGFVVAGFLNRKRPDVHKRFMLIATIGGLLWPTIVRLPFVSGRFLPMFGVLILFALAGSVHDLITRRRVHPVFLWGGVLIIAAIPIRRLIGLSDGWHRIAEWLIG